MKIQHYHFDAVRQVPGKAEDHAGWRWIAAGSFAILLYGSNMSNSNAHNHFPLPNLVVGGGAGTLEGRTGT